eukprot:6036566-Ditylum_brightwellii.AAC.1
MMLKQLAKQLVVKWACHKSMTQTYIKQIVQVAIVQATHCWLRGSRVSPRRTGLTFLPFKDDAES